VTPQNHALRQGKIPKMHNTHAISGKILLTGVKSPEWINF